MTKASAIKCEWSKPCYKAAKLHSIVLDDRKINLNLCDAHWARLRRANSILFGSENCLCSFCTEIRTLRISTLGHDSTSRRGDGRGSWSSSLGGWDERVSRNPC